MPAQAAEPSDRGLPGDGHCHCDPGEDKSHAQPVGGEHRRPGGQVGGGEGGAGEGEEDGEGAGEGGDPVCDTEEGETTAVSGSRASTVSSKVVAPPTAATTSISPEFSDS